MNNIQARIESLSDRMRRISARTDVPMQIKRDKLNAMNIELAGLIRDHAESVKKCKPVTH